MLFMVENSSVRRLMKNKKYSNQGLFLVAIFSCASVRYIFVWREKAGGGITHNPVEQGSATFWVQIFGVDVIMSSMSSQKWLG